MEFYAEHFTNKHPFRYVVKSPMYFVGTINKRKYIKLLQQIKRGSISEFTPQQALKLEIAGFSVSRRL